MAKVMMVTPDYHCGVVESAGKWLNCGFITMAGELRKYGHEVKIYDAMSKNHRLPEIVENIVAWSPDWVVSTAYTSTIIAASEVLTKAKELLPDVITVVGGVHPTFCYNEVLKDYPLIDYIVCGEGELTLAELVNTVSNGESLEDVLGIAYRVGSEIHKTGNRPFVENLDSLTPAWDLVEWKDYTYFIFPGSRLGVISSSRGCKHDCQFCSQRKFWKQSWRGRSAENVISEIRHLKEEYSVDVVLFADEFPTCDRERWVAILDGLIEADLGVKLLIETRVDDIVRDEDIMGKYRQAGIVHIYIGVESTSQTMLDRFKKGILENESKKALDLINQAGMVTETSFVLGTPEETKESIKQTLELAKEYSPDFAHFLLLAPWSYADMYDELEPYVETFDYSKYNLVEPIIKPVAMTRDELFQEVLNCYQGYYFSKMGEWAKLKDPFKKDYILRSMRVIMSNSFITQHIPKLGSMPKKLKKLLKSAN
jgi:anaerobic magnesium-protoporphyrin IX monomethyl ester cyclase